MWRVPISVGLWILREPNLDWAWAIGPELGVNSNCNIGPWVSKLIGPKPNFFDFDSFSFLFSFLFTPQKLSFAPLYPWSAKLTQSTYSFYFFLFLFCPVSFFFSGPASLIFLSSFPLSFWPESFFSLHSSLSILFCHLQAREWWRGKDGVEDGFSGWAWQQRWLERHGVALG